MPILAWRTDADGCMFENSWTFDARERAALSALVAPTLAGIIPLLGLAFPPILADPLLQTAIAAAAQSYLAFGPLPGYGMCGGMAWSSLDYWLAKSQLPSGATRFGQPQHTPASQAAVRDMIWQRLIDSLTTGGALSKTLEWSLILNQIPEVLVA